MASTVHEALFLGEHRPGRGCTRRTHVPHGRARRDAAQPASVLMVYRYTSVPVYTCRILLHMAWRLVPYFLFTQSEPVHPYIED
jgi:hypothetical protein